jgi:hypothetical protein
MQEKLVDAYQSIRRLARITVALLVPKRKFTMCCASCEPDNVPFHSVRRRAKPEHFDMPQFKHAKFAWKSLFAGCAACRCCLFGYGMISTRSHLFLARLVKAVALYADMI